MTWSQEELREAYRELIRRAPPATPCPDPSLFQGHLQGTASIEDRQALADHLEVCPRCAGFLQELRGLSDWAERAAAVARRAAAVRRHAAISARQWLPALAASLLLVVGGGLLWSWLGPASREGGGGSVQRAADERVIRSALGDQEPLPRDRFDLQWRVEAAAESYAVEVLDGRLRLLYRAVALEEARLTVPPEAFGGLPAGERIYWRVEATLADGRRVPSPTFVQRLR